MQRIFPFEQKNRVGKARWYERVGVNYAAATEARITSNYDSISKGVETINQRLQTGMSHNFNVSTNERLFKFFSFSPSARFTSRWYPSRKNYSYQGNDSLVTDTLSGFSTVNTFSASANL